MSGADELLCEGSGKDGVFEVEFVFPAGTQQDDVLLGVDEVLRQGT